MERQTKETYIGATDDVIRRLDEHKRGSNKYTKGGIPWRMIYKEEFVTKTEALKREKILKSAQGRMWLDEKFPEYRRGAGVV